MPVTLGKQLSSAFTSRGLRKAIDDHIEEAQELYLADQIPWVVGGRDRTLFQTCLFSSPVWPALRPSLRHPGRSGTLSGRARRAGTLG